MNKKTVLTFLLATALSVVLAGCAGGGAASSAASSASVDAAASSAAVASAGTVSLQIVNVDETGAPVVMLNKSYGFEDGAVIALSGGEVSIRKE